MNGKLACRRNVAIPSGDLAPNGVVVIPPRQEIQTTVHVAGTFFKKSPGFETLRPGRHRLQDAYHGLGYHFTPHRYAEDVGSPQLGLLVDEDTAGMHADIAELPGSERLDDLGKLTAEEDLGTVKLAERGDFPTAGGESFDDRHAHTVDLTGMRDDVVGVQREVTRYGKGILKNPVDFLSDEYRKTPVKAVALASLIVGGLWAIGREFDRAYGARKGRAGAVAAVPAAGADTAGATVGAIVTAPAKVVEAVGDAVAAVGETVAETAEKTGDAVADAVSGGE